MINFTSRILNFWLPKKARENEFHDIRLNILIKIGFLLLGMGLLGLVIAFFVTPNESLIIYFYISSVGSILTGFLMLVLIRTTGNAELIFNVVSPLGLIILLIPVINGTGIYSSTIWWILSLPVTAFFIVSKRSGIAWAIIAIISVLTIYALQMKQEPDASLMDTPIRRIVDICLIISYTCFILYLYEKNRDELIVKMREAHSELKKQNGFLSELNRENETLIAIVAHDLKAPQHQLQTLMKIMEMELKKNGPTEEHISIANKIIAGSLHMINDITYTKEISEELLIESKEPLYPWEFITKTCEEFDAGAQEKNITIVRELHQSDKILQVDRNSLSRILQNLISNAIKFSPFGKSVFVKLTFENDLWVIGIKDEGPGINPKDRQLLFKRFQKLSARPTNKESSSGLGLYIVKTLTRKIGGDIVLVSDQKQGAEFRLMIPA